MKKPLLLLFLCCIAKAYAQDTAQQKRRIDSMIFMINHSVLFAIRHDSTTLDMPALKMNMKTYETTIMDGKKLMKFSKVGRTKTGENEDQKLLITSTAFYYDAAQLIKVEEYGAPDSSHEVRIEWYYQNGKPLYYVTNPPADTKEKVTKLDERFKTLLIMAGEIKQQAESKIPSM